MKASNGIRRGTRKKFKKEFRNKIRINEIIKSFKPEDKVTIKINPTYHKSMPYSKFKGFCGIIMGAKGDAYIVKVKTGKKNKTIISRPEHLKLINNKK